MCARCRAGLAGRPLRGGSRHGAGRAARPPIPEHGQLLGRPVSRGSAAPPPPGPHRGNARPIPCTDCAAGCAPRASWPPLPARRGIGGACSRPCLKRRCDKGLWNSAPGGPPRSWHGRRQKKGEDGRLGGGPSIPGAGGAALGKAGRPLISCPLPAGDRPQAARHAAAKHGHGLAAPATAAAAAPRDAYYGSIRTPARANRRQLSPVRPVHDATQDARPPARAL